MCELYRRYSGHKETVCAAYVLAEQRGDVERRSNKRGISAEEYASALWNDGIRKRVAH